MKTETDAPSPSLLPRLASLLRRRPEKDEQRFVPRMQLLMSPDQESALPGSTGGGASGSQPDAPTPTPSPRKARSGSAKEATAGPPGGEASGSRPSEPAPKYKTRRSRSEASADAMGPAGNSEGVSSVASEGERKTRTRRSQPEAYHENGKWELATAKKASSTYRWVTKVKDGRFVASVRTKYIGSFRTEEEAAEAVWQYKQTGQTRSAGRRKSAASASAGEDAASAGPADVIGAGRADAANAASVATTNAGEEAANVSRSDAADGGGTAAADAETGAPTSAGDADLERASGVPSRPKRRRLTTKVSDTSSYPPPEASTMGVVVCVDGDEGEEGRRADTKPTRSGRISKRPSTDTRPKAVRKKPSSAQKGGSKRGGAGAHEKRAAVKTNRVSAKDTPLKKPAAANSARKGGKKPPGSAEDGAARRWFTVKSYLHIGLRLKIGHTYSEAMLRSRCRDHPSYPKRKETLESAFTDPELLMPARAPRVVK